MYLGVETGSSAKTDKLQFFKVRYNGTVQAVKTTFNLSRYLC